MAGTEIQRSETGVSPNTGTVAAGNLTLTIAFSTNS
jgi:hypothetical protein